MFSKNGAKFSWLHIFLSADCLNNLTIKLHLNPASVEFAEDLPAAGRCKAARVQTYYDQVLANTADSVKSALLKGKLFSKITTFMAASN